MILHLIFLALYVGLGNSLPGEWINGMLIIQCMLALLLDTDIRKKNRFASPLNVWYVLNIINTLANIVLIGKVGTSTNVTYAYIVPESIDLASLIWVVGVTMSFIGYKLFSKLSLPSIAYNISDKAAQKAFIYILLISLFFPVIKDYVRFLGTFSKILVIPGLIGTLFYARLGAKFNNRKYITYALIILVVQTAIAIKTAFLRLELVLPLLVFFVGYFLGQKSFKALFSYKVIPFAVVAIAFSTIFSDLGKYRSNFGDAIVDAYSFDDDDANTVESSYVDDQLKDQSGGILDRSSCLAQITLVLKLVNRNGFYNGTASAPIAVALIPRVLWPDKPNIMLGQWFALETGIAYKTESNKINNSVNMTIPGELYLDFGWLGVILGCTLFGAFISVLWNSAGFYLSEYNIMGILMGGFVLIFSITGVSGDLQLSITYIGVYLMFYVIRQILPPPDKTK